MIVEKKNRRKSKFFASFEHKGIFLSGEGLHTAKKKKQKGILEDVKTKVAA